MATVVNEIDTTLQSASIRSTISLISDITLNSNPSIFHIDANGASDVSSIVVNAVLVDLEGPVQWSAVGATIYSTTATTATIRCQDVTGTQAVVTATITAGGKTFTRQYTLSVVRDGVKGAGGSRGAGHYYATGASWNNIVANAACPGGAITNDVVTISNGSNFVDERTYDGANWISLGVVIRGDALVNGSVTAAKVNTNGLDIRDAAGNVLFQAGKAISNQVSVNANLVENLRSWLLYAGATKTTDTVAAVDGSVITLPVNAYATSRPLKLAVNTDYTLSFKAKAAAANTTFTVDLYPDTLPEKAFTVGTTWLDCQVKWNSSDANMNSAVLRLLGSTAAQVQVCELKLERGAVKTMYCDSVITPDNISTFIAAAAIKLAYIDKADITNLSALSAYLGTVEVAAGGALRSGQTAYNTGSGFYIGNDGLSIGVAGGANLRYSPADGLHLDMATLDSYTAWFSGSAGGSYPNGSAGYGSLTVNTSGGKAPYTYAWTLTKSNSTGAAGNMVISSSSSQSASFSGSGTNCSMEYRVTCAVTDANQRTIVLGTTINVTHGTPP